MSQFKNILVELSKYISISIVVTLSVVFTGWGLKSLAELKNRKPQVPASQIVLLAKNATIVGKGETRVEKFKGETNIGWWDFKSQSLRWQFPKLTKPTLYQVEMRYARPGSAPCTLLLKTEAFEQKIILPGTGSWGSWKNSKLFKIKLNPSQSKPIDLKVLELPSKGVINFVHLKFTPIKS